MMSDYEQITLGEKQNLTVEVNYNSAVKPCKYLRFKIGNEVADVSREQLFGLLFLYGDDKQQEDLIPVKELRVRNIKRLIGLTADRDIRRGETVRGWYEYFVPETVYEKLLLSNPNKYKSGDGGDSDLAKHVNKIV